ncbi:MAG: site-specific DNA-methyltransferase [Treponema sp.]
MSLTNTSNTPETNALKSEVEKILAEVPDFVDENKTLKINIIKDYAERGDVKLLEPLLKNRRTKRAFFKPVLDSFVFNSVQFKEFLEYSSACNSYSKYLGQKIGLYTGDSSLLDRNEVVLNFPFKDCVLEGGQKKEDGLDSYFEYDEKKGEYAEKQSKRREIFYNEVLARDEIDSLFSPKAFCNAKRYEKGKSGAVEPVETTKLNRNAELNKKRGLAEDTITDNLIIKGNNLLALHSLKKEFAGKVKLIYIDVPYNTGSDSFSYNDNFNHSSWLTFMKNRLEVAHLLLKNDGAIFLQIDHHELGYITVLMDEIFGLHNKVQIIAVKAASVSGFKSVNPGPIDITEYILFYTKNKSAFEFRKNRIKSEYNTNYNQFLETHNTDDTSKWEFFPIKEHLLNSINKSEKELKVQFGDMYKTVINQMIATYAFDNADNIISIRDLHKPTEKMKELQELSRINRNTIYTYTKTSGEKTYLYNGGAIAYYSSKLQIIDNEKCVTELLSDFWNHISWAGIAKEGGVKLKNGKKPEKLLKQIFEIGSNYNDIILDYHLGSGTTAAVAHKMNRQYIGIEQLDYGENDSVVRLQNVINGDQTGISKSVNWQGGGSFVYLELAKKNEKALEQISDCKSLEELAQLFDELCTKYFLHYNVRIKEFRKEIETERFKSLPLEKQKEMFSRLLDLNQLYVNADDRHDKNSGLSKNDIAVTEDFYQLK